MANDVEFHFLGLFTIFTYYIEMSLSLLPISDWIDLKKKLLSFESYLCILHTGALLDVWSVNMFSQSVACLFILLTCISRSKILNYEESK